MVTVGYCHEGFEYRFDYEGEQTEMYFECCSPLNRYAVPEYSTGKEVEFHIFTHEYGELTDNGTAYPVIYADSRGSPAEKLSVDEPLLDITHDPWEGRWVQGNVRLKRCLKKDEYVWIGIYAMTSGFTFTFKDLLSPAKSDRIHLIDYTEGPPPETATSYTWDKYPPAELPFYFTYEEGPGPQNYSLEINDTAGSADCSLLLKYRRKLSVSDMFGVEGSCGSLSRLTMKIREMLSLVSDHRGILRMRAVYEKVVRTVAGLKDRTDTLKEAVVKIIDGLPVLSDMKAVRIIMRFLETAAGLWDKLRKIPLVGRQELLLFCPVTAELEAESLMK